MILDDVVQKLEKEMDDFRRETSTTLGRNQKMILEGKKEHDQKMRESARLQVLLKEGKAEVVTLEQDLVVANDDLAQITETKSGQVATMKVCAVNCFARPLRWLKVRKGVLYVTLIDVAPIRMEGLEKYLFQLIQ